MTYFLNFILDNSNAIDVVLSLALLVFIFFFVRRLSNLENHINDLQEQLRKLSADCRTLKADTERLGNDLLQKTEELNGLGYNSYESLQRIIALENNKLQTPPCLKVKDLNISKLTTVKKTRKKSTTVY